MSEDLIEVILVYSTIPAFIVLLFILLYLIIRYRFHLSLLQEGKQALKRAMKEQKPAPEFSPAIYLLTFLFIAFVLVIAYVAGKSKPQ